MKIVNSEDISIVKYFPKGLKNDDAVLSSGITTDPNREASETLMDALDTIASLDNIQFTSSLLTSMT